MARIVVMYKRPSDVAAFDAYYFNKHVPLAKKLPGLRSYEVNAGPAGTPQGPSEIQLIAILTFDSMDAIRAALTSEEGQATVADLGNFAQAGADIKMFDTREV